MARPNSNIGSFSDFNIGGTGSTILSDYRWQGASSPGGSIAYEVGQIVEYENQLWVAINNSDDSTPSVTSTDWRAIQAVDSQSVVLITHNIESTPSTVQRDQLFLVGNLAYRKVTDGSFTANIDDFVIADAFGRLPQRTYDAGTFFVRPGRLVVTNAAPLTIGNAVPFPTVEGGEVTLVAMAEDLRQGDLWIDEFDGRTSTYVATNSDRVFTPVQRSNGTVYTLRFPSAGATVNINISQEDFDRIPAGSNVTVTITGADTMEYVFTGLQAIIDENDNPVLRYFLQRPSTQFPDIRDDFALFADTAIFPDETGFTQPTPNRIFALDPFRVSALSGSWIQIGGAHVDGGADFNFGTFRTPIETPLNFGTFSDPTGPALNLGAF